MSLFCFVNLLVKKSAVQATILWKVTWLSKGMYWLRKVSRSLVIVFLHMVTSKREKVKDIAAAVPRVKLIP